MVRLRNSSQTRVINEESRDVDKELHDLRRLEKLQLGNDAVLSFLGMEIRIQLTFMQKRLIGLRGTRLKWSMTKLETLIHP